MHRFSSCCSSAVHLLFNFSSWFSTIFRARLIFVWTSFNKILLLISEVKLIFSIWIYFSVTTAKNVWYCTVNQQVRTLAWTCEAISLYINISSWSQEIHFWWKRDSGNWCEFQISLTLCKICYSYSFTFVTNANDGVFFYFNTVVTFWNTYLSARFHFHKFVNVLSIWQRWNRITIYIFYRFWKKRIIWSYMQVK